MRSRKAPLPPASFAGFPFPAAPAAFSAPARTAPALSALAARDPEEEQRADDLALLRALVPHLASTVDAYDETAEPCADPAEEGEVAEDENGERQQAEDELVAFADMLGKLDAGAARSLSQKQRGWAVRAAERLDLSWGDPGARNRAVPKGADVPLLVDFMARPLAPPGRKPTELPGRKLGDAEPGYVRRPDGRGERAE